MWSADARRSHVRRAVLLGATAVALAAAMVSVAPAVRANTGYDPATHTITFHLLFHGPGADGLTVTGWLRTLQNWYDAPPFSDHGIKVRFDYRSQRDKADTCPEDRHCILVLDVPPGTVSNSGCSGPSAPVGQQWSGGRLSKVLCVFYKDSADETILHEFGHLLGFPDRYVRDAAGNVQRDPTRPDDIMNYAQPGKKHQVDDIEALLAAMGAATVTPEPTPATTSTEPTPEPTPEATPGPTAEPTPSPRQFALSGSFTLIGVDVPCNTSKAPITGGPITITVDFAGTAFGRLDGTGSGTRQATCNDDAGTMAWSQKYGGAFSGSIDPKTGSLTLRGTLTGGEVIAYSNCTHAGEPMDCPTYTGGPYTFPFRIEGVVDPQTGNALGTFIVENLTPEPLGNWSASP